MSKKVVMLSGNKKHLTKEEKSIRKTAENQASDGFEMMQVSPPNYLPAMAKQEYKRVIKDIQKLPLRNMDRAMLENYCVWYAVFKQASKILAKQKIMLEDEDGLLIPNPLYNHTLRTIEKASKNIRSAASELGLTIDSRMKIFLPKTEEKQESIFDKFG